jgi:UV DNA damage endonuclease
MPSRFGYACLNMTLSEQKPRITCNRGMIKRTFMAKGLVYASELALQNTFDLIKIIKWNIDHDIKVFRITSCLFPWASEYQLEQLPHYYQIETNLKLAGKIAREAGVRLSFHPGPFNILSSPKEKVVENSYKDLELHGKIFDIMGMPQNHWSKINIHIGAAYGNHEKAIDTWLKNFDGLSYSVKSRLTIENDDRKNLYSTKMLYDMVCSKYNIPIVFE